MSQSNQIEQTPDSEVAQLLEANDNSLLHQSNESINSFVDEETGQIDEEPIFNNPNFGTPPLGYVWHDKGFLWGRSLVKKTSSNYKTNLDLLNMFLTIVLLTIVSFTYNPGFKPGSLTWELFRWIVLSSMILPLFLLIDA